MANEFRIKNGLIVSGNATVSGIVLDGNTITGVDDSGEFTDNDAHIMTSAGINDKFGVIAGSTSIVTVGTITTGTWNGTAIDLANYVTGVLPSANLDADTAHLSGTQTFSGNKTFSGSITLGGHAFDDIDIGSEFVDTDDHIMSSGAIKEKIEAYSYITASSSDTLSNKTIAISQVTELSNLTASEGAQLENIGSTTISATQWGYLGAASGAITNTDTNTTYSGGTNLTLAGTTFNVDDAFLKNNADDTTSGTITAGGFTTTGSITLGGHAVNDIDVAGEFVDSDNHLMTAAAINDRISAVGGGIADLVDDTSPQLGGDLDTNGHDIIIDDGKGIYATAISNGLELMLFQHTASANSFIQVWNGIADDAAGTLFGNDVVSTDTAGTGRMTGPGFEATGSTTDVGMSFRTKGLGQFVFFSDDTSASSAPVINLMRHVDDNQVADDDVLGLIQFMGGDSSMATPFLHDLRAYGKIECNLVDVSNGSADGNLMFSALVADSHTDYLEIGTNKTNDTSAGVRAFTGSMVTYSGTGTTALSRDTHAGAYVRATGAGTFTLWDSPKTGDQVVVISDHSGTTTIDGHSSDTINGAANTTITTQYNAKTFIATSSSTWIALG